MLYWLYRRCRVLRCALCLSVFFVSHYLIADFLQYDNDELGDVAIRTSINQHPLSVPAIRSSSNQSHIPRIIHQSWNDYNIPRMTKAWIEKWTQLNPGWKYVFWTDKSSRAFISRYFPQYVELYDSFELPVQRADLFRYFILYSVGGVYADIDVEPLQSLEKVRAMAPCVLGQEPEVHFRILHPYFGTDENNHTLACNAFMACRARHPFMAFLIEKIEERRRTNATCTLPETLLCTGPYILSISWVKYKALVESILQQYPENDVICPKADYFLPTWDRLRTGWIKLICLTKFRYAKLNATQKQVCDRLKAAKYANKPKNISITNHHWFHSWTKERTKYLSRRYWKLHISRVVPSVIYGSDFLTGEPSDRIEWTIT